MAMEVATPAPAPIPSERNIVLAPATTTTTATVETHKKNRIQVSNTKKPLFFYVNLAKVMIGNLNSSPDLRFFRSNESSFSSILTDSVY